MIDGKSGCFHAQTYSLCLVSKTERPIYLNVTYCYTPISDTPFSVGINMPSMNQFTQSISSNLTQEIYSKGIKALKPTLKKIKVEIANWIFCDIPAELQNSNPAIEKFYPTAFELYTYLNSTETQNSNILNKCDLEALNYMLATGEIISNVTNSVWSADTLINMGISSLYIISASGYISSFGEYMNLSRNIWREELYMHPVVYQTSYGEPIFVNIHSGFYQQNVR